MPSVYYFNFWYIFSNLDKTLDLKSRSFIQNHNLVNIFLYDFVNGFYKQCAKSNKIDTRERESDNKMILFR